MKLIWTNDCSYQFNLEHLDRNFKSIHIMNTPELYLGVENESGAFAHCFLECNSTYMTVLSCVQ